MCFFWMGVTGNLGTLVTLDTIIVQWDSLVIQFLFIMKGKLGLMLNSKQVLVQRDNNNLQFQDKENPLRVKMTETQHEG